MADNRTPLVKATLVGSDREKLISNALELEQDPNKFRDVDVIEPPLDLDMLCALLEHSNSLRPNIDAYMTNIESFGHELKPVIELEGDDAEERILDAWHEEQDFQRRRTEQEGGAFEERPEPTPERIQEMKEKLVQLFRREKTRIQRFFESCCATHSFVELRRMTRTDLETTGNAYWEILRNPFGEICEFVYVPGASVRLRSKSKELIAVDERVKISDLAFDVMPRTRQFRSYAQVNEQHRVFFKEFGDPRIMSAKTGKYFPSEAALKKADKGDRPANELLHFRIHAPRTSYGVPRWIGALLSVMGSRQAEEVNFMFFENKSVPPMAITVSGGRLGSESVTRLEDLIENEIKGKRNFHKVLILEAEPIGAGSPDGGGRVRIDIKPLTQAIHSDALFSKYDERNIDKTGMAFRMPRMLRGDVRDFNRSTSEAALRFAEQQVFQPERNSFDWIINQRILTALGVRFWKFKSNGPQTQDIETMAEIVLESLRRGAITPEEARNKLGDIFKETLKRIDADWTKQPLELTLAGVPLDDSEDGEIPEIEDEEGGIGAEKRKKKRRRRTWNRWRPKYSEAGEQAAALLELRDEIREAGEDILHGRAVIKDGTVVSFDVTKKDGEEPSVDERTDSP